MLAFATFDVANAKPTGQASQRGLPTYRLERKFTLCGTTQPLSILADVEQARGWLHVLGNLEHFIGHPYREYQRQVPGYPPVVCGPLARRSPNSRTKPAVAASAG